MATNKRYSVELNNYEDGFQIITLASSPKEAAQKMMVQIANKYNWKDKNTLNYWKDRLIKFSSGEVYGYHSKGCTYIKVYTNITSAVYYYVKWN